MFFGGKIRSEDLTYIPETGYEYPNLEQYIRDATAAYRLYVALYIGTTAYRVYVALYVGNTVPEKT